MKDYEVLTNLKKDRSNFDLQILQIKMLMKNAKAQIVEVKNELKCLKQ